MTGVPADSNDRVLYGPLDYHIMGDVNFKMYNNAEFQMAGVAAFPTIKVKAEDDSITSDNTLSDDDELFIPVEVNGIYIVRFGLLIDSNTTADFQYKLTVPANATGGFRSGITNVSFGSAITDAGDTDGVFGGDGILVVGDTAGNLTLQWAQETSDTGATVLKKGSYLSAQRVG